jgi:hypothetical protein
MGVDEFHDIDEPVGDIRTPSNSNETAYVRHLEATDDEIDDQDEELSEAIDAFVLTGAVKLWRNAIKPRDSYRHHTMLVHQSVRTADQRELADRIQQLWRAADFTGPKGKARLRALYTADVAPVSSARIEDDVPPVPAFDDLVPFVAQAIGRIMENGHNPVIVVNSDKEVQQQQQVLDFDRYDIWRILVGGAKLSRGFTVEGLTVTYFRRATDMTDSLTQMGRWFGFRPGYRDMVRLYIARHATFKSRVFDLYEAFENVAIDEAAFRAQLQQYSEWDEGRPRIRPIEIPPLVSQHLPWLRPTARNKMFNAVLEEQSEQPFTPAGYANRLDLLKLNLDTWRPLFGAAQTELVLPEFPGNGTFNAYVGIVDASELVDAIEASHYLPFYRERTVSPKTAFYRRLIKSGMLEEFLVVAPQPATERVEFAQVGERAVIARDRRAGRGGKFGEITDRKHRESVRSFVDGDVPSALVRYQAPARGAVLLYLARETEPSYQPSEQPIPSLVEPERGLVAAFSSYVPGAALAHMSSVLRFRVQDPEHVDAPTIDVAPNEPSDSADLAILQ